MKKWIAVWVALALMCLPVAALAQGNAIIGQNVNEDYGDYISGGCVLGDMLCLLGYSNVYTYRPGDADLRALAISGTETQDGNYRNLSQLFVWNEALYALATVSVSDEDSSRLDRAELMKVSLSDEGAALEAVCTLDVSPMIQEYENNSDLYYLQDGMALGDSLYLLANDDNGNNHIYRVPLDGSTASVVDLENPYLIAPYADGRMLVEVFDYAKSDGVRFVSLDPATGDAQPLAEIPELEMPLSGAVYSAESGRIFYCSAGYVMAVENLDFANAAQVADLSGNGGGRAGRLLPGDVYVMIDYEATTLRSTDPSDMEPTRLVVQLNGYSEAINKAYYDYSNAHDDVAVILAQDYVADSDVLDAMMNRSAQTDIYVLPVENRAYASLYARGYLAELDSSAAISQACADFYPQVRDAVTLDGKIVALPVNVYGWAVGVNEAALKRLGYAMEDVPDDWPGFLNFIGGLGQALSDSGVKLFDDYVTQSDALNSFSVQIMRDYQCWIDQNGQAQSYDTPALRDSLSALAAIDFAALGLSDDVHDGVGYVVYTMEGNDTTLLQTGVGCTLGNFYNGYTPLLLRFDTGSAPALPLEMYVAVVNPFSQNADRALEYLEAVLARQEDTLRYNLSGTLNEPVRSSYYDENIASLNERMEDLNAQLASAQPADRALFEQSIADCQESIDYTDKYDWTISPTDLEWYRARAENITLRRYSAITDDQDGEISSLAAQYSAGTISLESFLKQIDQKAQMMAMEGN